MLFPKYHFTATFQDLTKLTSFLKEIKRQWKYFKCAQFHVNEQWTTDKIFTVTSNVQIFISRSSYLSPKLRWMCRKNRTEPSVCLIQKLETQSSESNATPDIILRRWLNLFGFFFLFLTAFLRVKLLDSYNIVGHRPRYKFCCRAQRWNAGATEISGVPTWGQSFVHTARSSMSAYDSSTAFQEKHP